RGRAPDRLPDDDAGLGIEAETVSAAVAAYYNMKECPAVPGALVCALDGDGAAALAGVGPGDVITALGDREILSAEELYAAAAECAAGEAVPITVYRDGEYLTLSAELKPKG
ncbi:MAG: PDZ domain-containing protein, partial [Oscillospiraceae bacterium]|nr:PDZ domain-containing protein [Oscillospiraceae bacterium]